MAGYPWSFTVTPSTITQITLTYGATSVTLNQTEISPNVYGFYYQDLSEGNTVTLSATGYVDVVATVGDSSVAFNKYVSTLSDGTNTYTIKDSEGRSLINGKADTSLSNLTDAGQIVAAKMSMPSGTYSTLTVGSSGDSYTAPSDGYFYAAGGGTGSAMWLELLGPVIAQGVYGTQAWNYKVYLPVKKGDSVIMSYNSINFDTFVFVYAEGSKSELPINAGNANVTPGGGNN